MRRVAIIIAALFVGCVYVGDHGTYAPNETMIQTGTNKLTDIDLRSRP